MPLFLALSTGHFGAGESATSSMLGVVARVLRDHDRPGRDRDGAAAAPARAGRSRLPAGAAISLGLFAIVVLGAIASEHDTVAENLADVAGAALALNVAAMSLSFAISKLARLDDRQSTAIALELGIHNSALAIAVGASLAAEVTIPAAVYSLLHALHRRRLRLGDEPPQRRRGRRRPSGPGGGLDCREGTGREPRGR